GRLGAKFVLGCPVGYGFDERFATQFREKVGGELVEVNDPAAAVRGADVIYTDVWTSMGQEAEREERLRRLAAFQLNAGLMAKAPPHCKVWPGLPAPRGEEIPDEVLDGPQSIVFDQAENRLHAQKAVLECLMK